ncbi:hypothetical protein B0T10DRAFT_193391, partial [Thelonectria olida]
KSSTLILSTLSTAHLECSLTIHVTPYFLRSNTMQSLFNYKTFAAIPKKQAGDYQDYYEWLTFIVWENWASGVNANVKRRHEFEGAVVEWTRYLGMLRYYSFNDAFYGKIKDSEHLDEMLAQTRFCQLDGSWAKKPSDMDGVLFQKIDLENVGWKDLTPLERQVIKYSTLRICLIHYKRAGFGTRDTKEPKDTSMPTMPELTTATWGPQGGRAALFLKELHTLVNAYDDARTKKPSSFAQKKNVAPQKTTEDQEDPADEIPISTVPGEQPLKGQWPGQKWL